MKYIFLTYIKYMYSINNNLFFERLNLIFMKEKFLPAQINIINNSSILIVTQ